jgi:sulfate adenylyltransferase subunit 1 (EFTu-like GTPase family)
VQSAQADQAVTLTLDREIDISRGDLLCSARDAIDVTRSIDAEVCWFDAEPMVPERPYLLKLGARQVRAMVSAPGERIDVETLSWAPGEGGLQMNDIGRVRVRTQQPLPVEPYARNRARGAFILIDELTKRTVGAGVVR